MGTICWPLVNSPRVSASGVEPTTCHKVLHLVRIVPLCLTSEGLVGLIGWLTK